MVGSAAPRLTQLEDYRRLGGVTVGIRARVKGVEEGRDQGIAKIVDLKKYLDEAIDEIVVLKKAVRHNSGGGVPHVKVKELKSFDGTRSAKTLGKFLWDMEQYLERLGLYDYETKVKVAAQLLTKDAEMWREERERIRTLEEAFAAVDRLVEHYDETSDDRKKSDKPKDKKKGDASKSDDSSKTKKVLKCWICAGPHTVKNCPSKPKVAAIAQSNAKNEEASVGMMQILGGATTEVISRRDPKRNKLEYVRIKVGDADILPKVDSGASHNFMGEDTARRIGLKFVPIKAQIKTMNSPLDEVLGVAEKVDTTLGEWTGKVDFTIVRIYDYEAVLGMEFMKQFDAMIVPHLKKLYIYDGREDVPIGVPTIGVTRSDCKLAVMQMEDEKRMDDMSKQLSMVETKLTEQSLVIRTLSDSILDFSRRLEEVEDDEAYVRSNDREEDRVTYLQRMEIEDPDRWIEMISEGEPSGSTPSTSS
eukprot:PITA_21800